MVVLCGDSHTTTYGALGALGFGIGTSEVEHVLATQTLVYRVAQTMRITIDGALPYGTSSKDVILWIISRIGAQGARGYAVEFAGSTIASLSAEARMTLCNMTVEAGARAALIAPDATTFDYVRAHATSLDDAAWAAAMNDWRELKSDAGAAFDVEHHFDAHDIAPFVTWGTSPDQAIAVDQRIPGAAAQKTPEAAAALRRALDYIGLDADQPIAGTPIDRVFIGSCTNGRIEDLRIVAAIVRGRHVAQGVRAMVVPGSGSVRRQAEAEGIAATAARCGLRMARAGLLDVSRDERRFSRSRRALRIHDQPQFRRTPGARRPHASDEPRDGRGRCTDRAHHRRPHAGDATMLTRKLTDIDGIAAPLPIENLDTDQIMPKQFLRIIDKAGLSEGLLYDLRFDAARRAAPRLRAESGGVSRRAHSDRRLEFRLRLESRACGVGASAIRFRRGDRAEFRGDFLFERDE